MIPLYEAKASSIGNGQKDQLIEQIKQQKKLIKGKALNIIKLEKQIKGQEKELGDSLQILFGRNISPSEEMIGKISDKQAQIIKIGNKIDKTSRHINKEKTQADKNYQKENYEQALADNDKLISLLNEEEGLLNTFSTSLQDYIDLVKALENK